MTDQTAPDEVPAPSTDVAVPERRHAAPAPTDTDSWVDVARPVFNLAAQIAETEFVPKALQGSPPAVAAAILYGREVGLPPMTALGGIHVVEGKPGLSAEMMRARILAAGHELEVVESTGSTCTLRGRRRGQERWTPVTWDIRMAQAAGLDRKAVWRQYPRTQLQARATTELARLLFPDVIHGLASVEELDDMRDDDGTETGPDTPTSSRVSRATRKAAPARKAAASTPAGPPTSPAAPPAPPLPGEAGYDETPEDPNGPQEAARPAEEPAETRPEEDKPTRPAEAPAETRPAEEPRHEATAGAPGPISPGQLRAVNAALSGLGLGGTDRRPERLSAVGRIVGRDVESTSNLTRAEARTILDMLATVQTLEELRAILDAAEAEQTGDPA